MPAAKATTRNTTPAKPASGPAMPTIDTQTTGTRVTPPSTTPGVPNRSFKWAAPPAANSGSARNPDAYKAEAELLRTRPGEYAVIQEFDGKSSRSAAYRLAKRVKEGTLPAFAPAGSFEAVSRATGRSQAVFARFVGDAK